jgi:elongation factor G
VTVTGSSGGAGQAGAGRESGAGGIRNVVLVGHSGSGKTTLAEALLLHTGTVARAGRVEEGTTASDFDEVEIRQKRSVNLALTPFVSDGITVNLLDTPGYADFTGDLRAGLRAAACALFVVAATDGVDGVTRLLWDECAAVGMPRAVVITKIDHGRADYATVLAECQGAFGEGVLPLYLPVPGADGTGVTGLIGLLSQTLYDYSSGERSAAPDTDMSDDAQMARDSLIEGIITESEDETLMERYLSGETVPTDVLIGDLETAVALGSFYPVLAVSSPLGIGMAELLEIVTQAFPSPLTHPLPPVASAVTGEPVDGLTCDPEGPLLAEVVKTTSDPYVGRISLVRVFSGTLRPDMSVHVSGHGRAERGHPDHDDDERVGALTSPLGKQQRPITECPAGSICAVAKLSTAETGDTLSSREQPLLMEPWTMPDPLLPVAIVARSKADEDKLSAALGRLVAEDPTMRLEINAETHQLVLWCMGEAHADVLLDRLSARYSVAVDTVTLRVPLRETVSVSARGLGRNVKQTGGHGEYGICHIEVEPLPEGATGFEFVDKIVGGVVPRQYIPSVEKGVRAQMEAGILAGYPMTGLRVTLFDGKAHSVDSSDMAFQKAGRAALKDACEKAAPMLLEPVDEVSILVPDEYVGAVMSDLSGRRGRVIGTIPVGVGRTQIKAEVPELEITRYSIDLRSVSHGTGSFTRGYLRHEPLPSHLASKVTADSAKVS